MQGQNVRTACVSGRQPLDGHCRPLTQAVLTFTIYLNWPDSGLTRNTRAPGYRCSVPGLAGFTGTTLCGARSLITCQTASDS